MGDEAFSKKTWQSSDGLELHYRDYGGRDDRPPILCIPGLTRNARDFTPVADAFAGEWRVIACDLRGRGESDYAKESASYTPVQYVKDIAGLFEAAGLEKVVLLGTSLGGIISVMLAASEPDHIAGVVLNDIGPDVETDGMERIREYVGQGRSFPTWMHAARSLREGSIGTYPDYAMKDWLRLAKRQMCIGGSGRITLDYDMHIADALAQDMEGGIAADMWPVFRQLAGRPVLALRGELSDILSAETLARMARELPDCEAVTVPHVGHSPTLEEPVAQAAIARLLGKVA